MVDRNGMRGGAAISAVVLVVAFVLGWRGAVPAIAAALAIGPLFGMKRSPLGASYRTLKSGFKLSIPVEPEEEAPPRFAQVVGFIFLAAASIAFWPFKEHALGWALTLIVAALQTLLATTGICVGCEVYNFGRRFSSKAAA
jgi:hypothetical protein